MKTIHVHLHLQFFQFIELALLCHQLFIGSELFQSPVSNNRNFVCITYGRESVCHDQSRSVFYQVVDGCLDLFLGDTVQSRCRFIQYQDAWITHEGSGNGDPLSLSTTQVAAMLRNPGIQPLRKRVNKFTQVGGINDLLQFLITDIVFTIGNIIAYRSCKKNGRLWYDCNMLSEAFKIQLIPVVLMNPITRLSTVVLPAPEPPTKAIVSPSLIDRLKCDSTGSSLSG